MAIDPLAESVETLAEKSDGMGDEVKPAAAEKKRGNRLRQPTGDTMPTFPLDNDPVPYTHPRAHETPEQPVCRPPPDN